MKTRSDYSRSARLFTKAFWLFMVLLFPGEISLQAQSQPKPQQQPKGQSQSQSKCPDPPAYQPLRQDEDYSYLRNEDCKRDLWDPLKYIRLGSSDDKYLTIGGEAREWYEGFRNFLWGIGPQDGNGYLLSRLSAFGDFHVKPRLRFFAQLTNDIEAGRNGGPRPVIDEDRLWFEQAFADITLWKKEEEKKEAGPKKDSLVLRLGRQEFLFGSGRLVEYREGPNVHRSFDGASIRWKTGKWDVTGVATKLVRNRIGVFDSFIDPGTTFWGIYAVRQLSRTKDAKGAEGAVGKNIDLYYLGVARKQLVFDKGVGADLRHTIGARFWGRRGGWDYDSEAMIQIGSFRDVGLLAWANAHDTGYTFKSARFQPRIGTTFSVTSGDNGDPRSRLGTFSPLFPTGKYYGQGSISLNGPSNLIWVGPSLTLQITKSVQVIVDDDTFWRTSLNDGVYDLATNLLVSGKDNRERYVGSQTAAGVYWQYNRHLLLSAAYNHFSTGPFLRNANPRRRPVDYAAVWLTYKF
jgi:alginate export protein